MSKPTLNLGDRFLSRLLAQDAQHWITAHPNGGAGVPLLIEGEGSSYKIVGGAGGKLNGQSVSPGSMSKPNGGAERVDHHKEAAQHTALAAKAKSDQKEYGAKASELKRQLGYTYDPAHHKQISEYHDIMSGLHKEATAKKAFHTKEAARHTELAKSSIPSTANPEATTPGDAPEAPKSAKLDKLAKKVAGLEKDMQFANQYSDGIKKSFGLAPGFNSNKQHEYEGHIKAQRDHEIANRQLQMATKDVNEYHKNTKLLADVESSLAGLKSQRGTVEVKGKPVDVDELKQIASNVAFSLRRSIKHAKQWID